MAGINLTFKSIVTISWKPITFSYKYFNKKQFLQPFTLSSGRNNVSLAWDITMVAVKCLRFMRC